MLPKQQIVDQTTPCSKTNLQVSDNDVLLTQSGSNEQLADDAKDGQNSQPEQINKENDIAMTGAGMEECQEKLLSEINDSGINMQTDNIPSETETCEMVSESHQEIHSCSSHTAISQNDASVVNEQSSSQVKSSSLQRPGCDTAVRIKMLARVAVSDAHFKHQQRGDPDLTMEDKIEIAQKLLDENKVNFLSRFSQYLEIEDLEYFKNSRHIYEIDFYCKQVEKLKSVSYHRNRVKNRRYEAMKKLTLEGEYFSEEEMKFREPFLYDQMIGQYLTDDEIQAQVDKSDLRFSSILIRHMDLLDENARFARDKDKEDGQMEEEEEDSEEESELESDTENKTTDTDGGDNEKRKTIPEKERQELRQEFITIMQEKFLSGKDKNFDYSKVDNNEQYDDLDVLNLDAEEKYFDDEDSNSVHSVTTMETVNTMET